MYSKKKKKQNKQAKHMGKEVAQLILESVARRSSTANRNEGREQEEKKKHY